eukprot:14107096-Alexandrium_andersonii.AAC.1
MQLLGWTLKAEKDLAFAAEFDVLGVRFLLGEAFRDGSFAVANTERRRAELQQCLQRCVESDTMTAPEAASLAGKLQFASAQAFGRCGSAALAPIRRRSLA